MAIEFFPQFLQLGFALVEPFQQQTFESLLLLWLQIAAHDPFELRLFFGSQRLARCPIAVERELGEHTDQAAGWNATSAAAKRHKMHENGKCLCRFVAIFILSNCRASCDFPGSSEVTAAAGEYARARRR